jgi:uncharacterized membrane protein YbhN (UPF0104 family)
MNRKNTKAFLQFILLLGIGILLIWLSLKQVAPEKDLIIDAFKNADYFWIALSMVIALFSHFLRAFRWNYLLKPVGHRIGLLNSTCYVLVGYLANYGIPRMGEVSRCTLAARYNKVPFEVGFGTVITERIIDFVLFLLIFLLTLAFQFTELIGLARKLVFDKLRDRFNGDNNGLQLAVFTIAAIGIIAIFYFLRKKIAALFTGKVGGIIRGLGQGIGSISKMEHPFRFITISVMIWACYFYSLYFCFFALPGTMHLGQKECLTLLLFGTFGVIFSPGGLGAYPAIVGGILLYTYNIETVYAFALPWLAWSSQFAVVLLTGLVSLIVLPIYNRKKNVVSQPAQR